MCAYFAGRPAENTKSGPTIPAVIAGYPVCPRLREAEIKTRPARTSLIANRRSIAIRDLTTYADPPAAIASSSDVGIFIHRQEDDFCLRTGCLEAPGHIKAGQEWHGNIKDQQLRAGTHGGFECGTTIRDDHQHIEVWFEKQRHRLLHFQVIIGDNNASEHEWCLSYVLRGFADQPGAAYGYAFPIHIERDSRYESAPHLSEVTDPGGKDVERQGDWKMSRCFMAN